MKEQNPSEQEKYYKQKNLSNKIKGIGCLIAIVLIIIAIASNQNNQPQKVATVQSEQSNNLPSKPSEPIAPQSFKIGDVVKLDDEQLTVQSSADCNPDKNSLQPQAGNKYIVVDVTQENTGAEALMYNILNFKLQDEKGFTYNPSFFACKNPNFNSGTLQAGQKTRGFLNFEIPKDSKASQLIYTPSLLGTKQIIIQLL